MNDLKNYIEIDGYPKLGYQAKYSKEFEQHYELFQENICPIKSGSDIYFYCWKDEFERFIRFINEKKLYYKSQLLDKEDNDFLREYTKHFEEGFNEFDYHTPKEVILKYLPFMPKPTWNGAKIIGCGIGRKNSYPGLCLYGSRPLGIHHELFNGGSGLLKNNRNYAFFNDKNLKGDDDLKWMGLADPIHAYKDGRMFKCIFLVIERYNEFESYFTDSLAAEQQKYETFDTNFDDPKELNILFDILLERELIAKDTEKIIFRAAFGADEHGYPKDEKIKLDRPFVPIKLNMSKVKARIFLTLISKHKTDKKAVPNKIKEKVIPELFQIKDPKSDDWIKLDIGNADKRDPEQHKNIFNNIIQEVKNNR